MTGRQPRNRDDTHASARARRQGCLRRMFCADQSDTASPPAGDQSPVGYAEDTPEHPSYAAGAGQWDSGAGGGGVPPADAVRARLSASGARHSISREARRASDAARDDGHARRSEIPQVI